MGGTTGKLENQSLVPVVIKQEREFFIFLAEDGGMDNGVSETYGYAGSAAGHCREVAADRGKGPRSVPAL
ncbi:hypothetical protein J42TS3_45760 [Paenibacillus vini]|uniref:Uncharacterized protein n=1 Tax=Paenibacillus vini TaxID=1476024 RepID=A0ABQ4MHT8_9BACL|nr:hypothetical protein J42TS3_45760 [Paenibacillus vini]